MLQQEKKDPIVESSPRFTARECGHPTLIPTELAFSVSKAILLRGFTVYGNAEGTYKYKMCLEKQGQSLSLKEGSFGGRDCIGDHCVVQLLFKEPVTLQVQCKRKLCLVNTLLTIPHVANHCYVI